MKKQIGYVIIIIIIIALGIIVAINLGKEETKQTSSENIQNKLEIENKNENEIFENTVNNEISNTVLSEEENKIEEEQKKEEPKTDLEKAIDIVKNDWGNDSNVYFANDGITRRWRISNMCEGREYNKGFKLVYSKYKNRRI